MKPSQVRGRTVCPHRGHCAVGEHPYPPTQEEEPHSRRSFVFSAGHWIRVLQCRQHCVADTATRPGRSFPVQDFIPGQLRRLHEAYVQGQLGKDGAWKWRLVSNAILSCVSLSFPSDSALLVSPVGTAASGWCPFGTIVQSSGDGLLAPSALVASPFPFIFSLIPLL